MVNRQKLLAGGFGLMAALYLGNMGWTRFVGDPLKRLERSQKSAENRYERTNSKLIAARAAKLQVAELAGASLPADTTKALAKYQEYLIGLLKAAKIANPTITPSQPTVRDGIGFVPFSVQAETSLKAFTQLLYSFYAAPRLQQIRRLSLHPIEGKAKEPGLRFSLTIEALAFADEEADPAAAKEALKPRVEPTPGAYADIVNRNALFVAGPGLAPLAGNMPEHVVLTSIVVQENQAEADLYDQATGKSRQLHVGDEVTIGQQTAKVLDLGLRDAAVEVAGALRRWQLGTSFAACQPLSPEQALERELEKVRVAQQAD